MNQTNLKITYKPIKIRDLVKGYVNETETDIESGVYAFDGKLCIRPEYQRSFVYNAKEESLVIDTILKGRPINIFYWEDNHDGTYNCMDGQQRFISICKFANHDSSYIGDAIEGCTRIYIDRLQRIDPEAYEAFMDYELMVYVCDGPHSEILRWFKTINIAGKPLTEQEMRNTSYPGEWLTDAKRHFSKANPDSTAKCPAEKIGGAFTNKNANRQELLEQVLLWITDPTEDEDEEEAICNYMEEHSHDKDASELWDYFQNVIEWAKDIFPTITKFTGFKSTNWGHLYNLYSENEYDAEEMCMILNKLIAAKANGELISVTGKNMVEYCFSRDESLFKHRLFNENQKLALYNKQDFRCADCGKHYELEQLHAHHIKSWWDGGRTDTDNGVLLCPTCHMRRHNGQNILKVA